MILTSSIGEETSSVDEYHNSVLRQLSTYKKHNKQLRDQNEKLLSNLASMRELVTSMFKKIETLHKHTPLLS